jgi:hypothetical protein
MHRRGLALVALGSLAGCLSPNPIYAPAADGGDAGIGARDAGAVDAACRAHQDCAQGFACVSSACAPLARALVGAWAFDEGEGALLEGTPSPGRMDRATWETPGRPGPRGASPACLAFDGTAVVRIDPAGLPDFGAPRTVSVWFQLVPPPGPSAKQNFVVFKSGDGTLAQLGLYLGRLSFWTSSKAPVAAAPVPGPGWHHLAHVYDGSLHTIYVDGAEVASAAAPLPRGALWAFMLGSHAGDTNEFFRGKLDDLRLWGRPLGPAEIAALAAGQ